MGNELYVVDYDIPVQPQAERRAFYRGLHRILREHGIIADRSTQSVWVLDSREIAQEIYKLAQNYGHSNLYTATRTDQGMSHV